DDEEVGSGNRRATLAWDFFALRHRDHIDGDVCQVRRESRRQIVAAALDQDDIEIGELAVEIVDGREVERGVFADRRMRTAARFNTDNAVLRNGLHAREDQRVFLRVDV